MSALMPSMSSLARYRSMRDFQVTAEPSGSAEEEVFQGDQPSCRL